MKSMRTTTLKLMICEVAPVVHCAMGLETEREGSLCPLEDRPSFCAADRRQFLCQHWVRAERVRKLEGLGKAGWSTHHPSENVMRCISIIHPLFGLSAEGILGCTRTHLCTGLCHLPARLIYLAFAGAPLHPCNMHIFGLSAGRATA